PRRVLDDAGRDATRGSVLRLQVEPDLYRTPPLLDLTYSGEPGRPADSRPLQLVLRPPTLQGAVLLGQVRWQVALPSSWMPLHASGGYEVDQKWAWWGPLLAPRPAMTGPELERWLTGGEQASPAQENEPSLVCWRAS